MKKLLAIVMSLGLLFSLSACVSGEDTPTAKQVSNKSVIDEFKAAGLPIDNVIVYDAKTDENQLLGRPNQYIAKTDFADTTIKQLPECDPIGGTIEQFANQADLKARKEYIEGMAAQMPKLGGYMYVKGNCLLRLDSDMSPDQAKKYQDVFMK